MNPPTEPTVWTIGHSNRSLDAFLALLHAHEIGQVADVRRYAGSRAHPHFNPDALAESLARVGIGYVPFPELGGRRTPVPGSKNTVWRNQAFRGYADYMETPEFRQGLERLVRVAGERPTTLLCAEAVWWRCHRSLIADALKADGIRVLHVMGGGRAVEHPYTSAASLVAGRLRYGAGPAGEARVGDDLQCLARRTDADPRTGDPGLESASGTKTDGTDQDPTRDPSR